MNRGGVALSRFETAWAAILVASILGIAFYAAVALAERVLASYGATLLAEPPTLAGLEKIRRV